MKVFTLGWISVFISIIFMNIYLWHSYWRIPFKSKRLPKLMSYSGIHLFLLGTTFFYFYLFFSGKTDRRESRLLSYISGFYITFLHYSFIFYLAHDLIYLLRGKIDYPDRLRIISDKIFFGGILIFSLAALISFYGIYNEGNIVTKKYNVDLARRESSLTKLNLVYLSDLHMGTSVNRDNLEGILIKIRALKPDLLLLGGDFFDEGTTVKDKEFLVARLAEIETSYGTFVVEGNHEYKSGQEDIDEEMEYFSTGGLVSLQDQVHEVEDKFYIVGRKDSYGDMMDLESLVEGLKDLPIILLDHRPSFKEARKIDKIGLQLSGHTHSGQFFPSQIFDPILSRLGQQYMYGKHRIGGLNLIVSSGVGNWGIPIRIGSKREILNISLRLD